MSCNPSKILGIGRGTLKVGAIADITVFDASAEWTVEADKLSSKSKNSPFLGWKVKGAAVSTIVDGRIVKAK